MTADDLPAAFASLPEAWARALPGWTRERCQAVIERVSEVSADRPIGPEDPFRALRLTPPEKVKVVVFGQDPYPTPGHADGLAFSALSGKPPSLRRIFAVLAADRPGFRPPQRWVLDDWARQGALLLNPTLTVELGRIGSHLDCGWQALTSDIARTLLDREDPPAYLLWGSKAQAFFEHAVPSPRREVCVWRTRHPSNDFHKKFMVEGSHFVATSDRIDWWAIGDR